MDFDPTFYLTSDVFNGVEIRGIRGLKKEVDIQILENSFRNPDFVNRNIVMDESRKSFRTIELIYKENNVSNIFGRKYFPILFLSEKSLALISASEMILEHPDFDLHTRQNEL